MDRSNIQMSETCTYRYVLYDKKYGNHYYFIKQDQD